MLAAPRRGAFLMPRRRQLVEFQTLNDEQLAEHLSAVIAEQDRRQRVAQTPDQIRTLTARYLEDGGDPSVLSLPEV